MKRKPTNIVILVVISFCALIFVGISIKEQGADRNPTANAGPISSTDLTRNDEKTTKVAANSFGHIEMGFEANQGQTDSSVDFLARGAGYKTGSKEQD